MDAKTAIEYLREDDERRVAIHIPSRQANEIADLIKSLSREAELGRAAVEAIENDDEAFGCCKGRFAECEDGCIHVEPGCPWEKFCRLRAGKENA